MKREFKSRISIGLTGIVLLFLFGMMIFMTISFKTIFNPGNYILVGTMLCAVFISTGIRYVITDDYLHTHLWGIPYPKISISSIVSVERSYNPLSAPAASTKRLCIRFKKGNKTSYTLISPVGEQDFLDILKEINPNIYIRVNKKAGR
jgi:hypothetical protein